MSRSALQQGGTSRVAIARRAGLDRLLIDGLPHGLLACDEAGRLIAVNQSARRILGEVVDRTWPEDAESLTIFERDLVTRCPVLELPLYNALRDDCDTERELCVRAEEAPSGVWITASGSPIHDEQGAIVGAMMTFREISRRKQIEAALGEDRQRLEHQYRRQAALAQVELVISEPQELQALLERIVRLCQELTPCSDASVVLQNPRAARSRSALPPYLGRTRRTPQRVCGAGVGRRGGSLITADH